MENKEWRDMKRRNRGCEIVKEHEESNIYEWREREREIDLGRRLFDGLRSASGWV